jgi:hypothetical protein
VGEPRILNPSTASAPARNKAKRKSAMPAISRRTTDARDSAPSVPFEPDELSVLIGGASSVRIQLAAREEIPGEAAGSVRLAAARLLEDLRDVVAIRA